MAKEPVRPELDGRRWREVVALFDALVELEAEHRATFLEKACDDEAVRQEVTELLVHDDAARAFLETPIVHHPEGMRTIVEWLLGTDADDSHPESRRTDDRPRPRDG